MKVLTWNVNGIRAVQRETSGLKKLLDSLNADVICLQETKVTRDMLDEPTAIVDNYESYFGFSRKKTGYSGTANFCRVSCLPCKAEEGLTGQLTTQTEGTVGHYGNVNEFSSDDLDALDNEGRCVITQHGIRLPDGKDKEVAIINVYVPRAGDKEERLEYKLKFLTLLQLRAETLLRSGVHVIVLGDINTTHTKKDHCDPDSNEEYIRKVSRIWFNQFLQASERDSTIPLTDGRYDEMPTSGLEGGHFSDVFRICHPDRENAFTNWCTMTGARQTNYGRRLDYILVDKQLAKYTKECIIMADVHGSDHCPVSLTLDCTPIASAINPPMCSKFMPEFRGQQKKLSAFFGKVSSSNSNGSESNLENKTINSKSKFKSLSSPLKKKSSTSSLLSFEPPPKKLHLAKEQSQGKKTKLKKEDSKQVSLKFFFQSNSTSKDSSVYCQAKQNIQDKNNTISLSHEDQNDCLDLHSQGRDSQEATTTIDAQLKSTKCLSSSSELSKSTSPGIKRLSSDSNSYKSSTNKTVVPSFSSSSGTSSSNTTLNAWKNILGGLPPPPLCSGHKEPSVLRTVKKEGPNKNKQFYVCARPDGAPGNPLSRCDFFQWRNVKKK